MMTRLTDEQIAKTLTRHHSLDTLDPDAKICNGCEYECDVFWPCDAHKALTDLQEARKALWNARSAMDQLMGDTALIGADDDSPEFLSMQEMSDILGDCDDPS